MGKGSGGSIKNFYKPYKPPTEVVKLRNIAEEHSDLKDRVEDLEERNEALEEKHNDLEGQYKVLSQKYAKRFWQLNELAKKHKQLQSENERLRKQVQPTAADG